MGCHTWFNRPITEEEFKWMKEYAVAEAEDLFGDTEENRRECPSAIEPYNIELVRKSVETGEACYYGMTWYEAGFGCSNPKFIEKNKAKPLVRTIRDRKQKGINSLFFDVCFEMEYATELYGFESYAEFEKSDVWKAVDFPWFHDVFRVRNYPNKVIHNRRELRRFLGKKYFDLTEHQLKRVSMFFKLYPGGVITFG